MSENLDPELAELESTLRKFFPVPSGIDRDRLMFLAGQASARRGRAAASPMPARWVWPCTTAASMVACLIMGGALMVKDRPQVVYVERQAVAPAPVAASGPAMDVSSPGRQEPEADDPELHDPSMVTGADWPPESMPIPSPKCERLKLTHDLGREANGRLGG